MKTIILSIFFGIQSLISFSQTTVYLQKDGGVYTVPCIVNGLNLKFIFDTGASDVSISLTEAMFMLKNGYLKSEDIIGKEFYQDATGKISAGTKILLRNIEFSGLHLWNVEASIVNELSAPLLLGQSAMAKLGKFQFDPNSGQLIIIGKNELNNANASIKLRREMASEFCKEKKFQSAIDIYEKIVSNDPDDLAPQDYFNLGRAYYFGPKDFVKSDSCFSKVTQAIPTFATAYFWRGKANVQQDPKNEKWLAKPHYEKALELVKPEERAGAKTNVIEACEYLGYYYLTVKDNTKAKEYFTIIKDLDPNNKKQIEFFKSPAGK